MTIEDKTLLSRLQEYLNSQIRESVLLSYMLNSSYPSRIYKLKLVNASLQSITKISRDLLLLGVLSVKRIKGKRIYSVEWRKWAKSCSSQIQPPMNEIIRDQEIIQIISDKRMICFFVLLLDKQNLIKILKSLNLVEDKKKAFVLLNLFTSKVNIGDYPILATSILISFFYMQLFNFNAANDKINKDKIISLFNSIANNNPLIKNNCKFDETTMKEITTLIEKAEKIIENYLGKNAKE